MHVAPAILLGTVVLAGCGETPTQIVLVIDTDIPVPGGIDNVVLHVEGAEGPTAALDETVPLAGDGGIPMPLSIGLVPAAGAGGEVLIDVRGRRTETVAVTRVVRTRFAVGESRLLRIVLEQACTSVTCEMSGQTCAAGVCGDEVISSGELSAFDGAIRTAEHCNGRDDDGDGATDETFDLAADAQNCGACGTVCAAGRLCVASSCSDSPIATIATGYDQTCATREAGGVTCWGGGTLGDGTYLATSYPVTTVGIADAAAVTVGAYYACVTRRTGEGACWGFGFWGELGTGTMEFLGVPAPVVGLTGAAEIDAAYAHTCARRSDGTASCFGQGTYGALGIGEIRETVPVPTAVVGVADLVSISAGYFHSCGVHGGGTVSCWGEGENGQLGNGSMLREPSPVPVTGLTDAVEIAAGEAFTCARTRGGTVRCWGANDAGQLGVDPATTPSSSTPVDVAGVSGATRLSIHAAGNFACVLAAGAVSCWGANDAGQLGDGTTTSRHTPGTVMLGPARDVSAGRNHACALLTDATLRCWGSNEWGQLGDATYTDAPLPVMVRGL